MNTESLVALHYELANCWINCGKPNFAKQHDMRAFELADGAVPSVKELTGDRVLIMQETCK